MGENEAQLNMLGIQIPLGDGTFRLIKDTANHTMPAKSVKPLYRGMQSKQQRGGRGKSPSNSIIISENVNVSEADG